MNSPIIVFPRAKTAAIQQRKLEPPGMGEVLVKNHKSLISIGTEMTAFCGVYPPAQSGKKRSLFLLMPVMPQLEK